MLFLVGGPSHFPKSWTSLDTCGCAEWSAKSTDGNSRSRIQDSNVIFTNVPHGLCGQSARCIAHLLPNFPGTRVTSFSTDGNLRLKFTVFARVFELRLLRHCFCTQTSFVFTQQLALWRVHVRHSASWKARSLLFSLPENGSACVSSHGRFGVSSLRPLCQRAGVNALHKERVSLCSASGGTRATLCNRTKSALLGARRSPLKLLQPRGGGVP